MTHLHIAKNIYQRFPEKIKDLSQFYLGNLAPDAVHNRAGYISDYKKISHLCVGDAHWGRVTNNDEWIDNVLSFLDKNKNPENYDFILGYCCHILSDIYNNITMWMPFILKYPDELEKGYGSLYHKEGYKVDIELALKDDNRENFWVYLEKAKPINVNSIVFEEEIEIHRNNILYNWYKDKKPQDLSSNKIITIESIMNFIKDATDFISKKINLYL